MDLTREGPSLVELGADWEIQGLRPRRRPFQPAVSGHPPWRTRHGAPGTAGTRELRRACGEEEQRQGARAGGNSLRPEPPLVASVLGDHAQLGHVLCLTRHRWASAWPLQTCLPPSPRPWAQHEPCGACLSAAPPIWVVSVCVSGRMVRGARQHLPRMWCAGFPGGPTDDFVLKGVAGWLESGFWG